MNTETGQIYRGVSDISAAQLRGEPLVLVTEAEARRVERAITPQKRRDIVNMLIRSNCLLRK